MTRQSVFVKMNKIWREGFRTQSNIYDEAFFVKLVNGSQQLTIFEKSSIIYVQLDYKYGFDVLPLYFHSSFQE